MGRNCALSNAKPISVVAAISFGIQGLIWSSIYLIALLQRYCVFSVGNEYSQTFKQYLVAYISDDQCPGTKGVLGCVPLLGPAMLLPWVVFAVFGNLILTASSVALPFVLSKCRKEIHYGFINMWIFFCLLAFCTEAGITSVFAMDFMELQDSTCIKDKGLAEIVVAFLLLISTHGILLGIANLGFIIFFFVVSIQTYNKYNIRNREIDFTSDWPSASSENSLFDFYNNKTKSDVVGVVNPIQEYPEYSAKGRWPTLRETAEQSRPPLRAWEMRSDLVDSARRDQVIVNNNNLIEQRENSIRTRKYIKIEPVTTKTTKQNENKSLEGKGISERQQPQFSSFGRLESSPREYSSSLPSHNQNIFGVNSKKDLPNSRPQLAAPITPPAPPLPALPSASVITPKLKISTIPKFEASTKFSSEEVAKVAEPDYTPPAIRKPFDTVGGVPSGARPQYAMMSLHEAIKSRPPLKPVFSRMKSTDC